MVTLEGEHGVHRVLQGPGASQVALLGDVTDQDDDDAMLLGLCDQRVGTHPDLAHAAGREWEAESRMVWIESITATAGRSARTASTTSVRSRPGANEIPWPSIPRRPAREATC